MSLVVTKELILVEDISFGFDVGNQDRGGVQFNAAYLPYTVDESVTDALEDRYLSSYIDSNFANIRGNSSNPFSVSDGVSPSDAVNMSQLVLKANSSEVDRKAYKDDVLELDNDTPYSPLYDYNPATKKYVDDSIFTSFQSGVNGSFVADGKTITVTGGLITGII